MLTDILFHFYKLRNDLMQQDKINKSFYFLHPHTQFLKFELTLKQLFRHELRYYW
jgi:hypothetical protein